MKGLEQKPLGPEDRFRSERNFGCRTVGQLVYSFLVGRGILSAARFLLLRSGASRAGVFTETRRRSVRRNSLAAAR